jgi:hypothetical protein
MQSPPNSLRYSDPIMTLSMPGDPPVVLHFSSWKAEGSFAAEAVMSARYAPARVDELPNLMLRIQKIPWTDVDLNIEFNVFLLQSEIRCCWYC